MNVDVLLQLRDAAVAAERLQLSDGAAEFVQRIERGLAQAVRAEISDLAIVAFNKLQSRRSAPVGKLVTERRSGCERLAVIVRQECQHVALGHRVERLPNAISPRMTLIQFRCAFGFRFSSAARIPVEDCGGPVAQVEAEGEGKMKGKWLGCLKILI
jgi:hypothetical protein